MRCGICGRHGPNTVEAAIDADWEPSYSLDRDTEVFEPVCPECSLFCCDHDDAGPILREGAAVPVTFPMFDGVDP